MEKNKLQKYINKANEIHNFKYDYSKITEIKNVKSPITIICPIHGEFNTNLDNHINHKTECPYCKGVGKKNEKDFIEQCKKIHSNKNYDFSLVKYVNCKTKVKVICHNKNILGEEHGVFEIKPTHLIDGHGCPKCSNRYMTTEEWIEKANKIHNFKYDYSLIEKYPNKQKEKGRFICHEIDDDGNEHGIFEMTYGSHIMGGGCPKCNGGIKSNKETFIKKANKIHKNYYSYDNFIYLNSKSKSYITCPKHGDFLQSACQHLRGQGCPKCNSSKLEKTLISFFSDNDIKYDYQVRFNDTKQTIDFFLPLKNLYIECQGEQHYIPINFSGSDDYETCLKVLEERKQLDYEKYNCVTSNGFKIVYFTMPEIFNVKNIDIFSGFYEDKNVFTNINDLKLYIDDLSDVTKINNTNLETRKKSFIEKAKEIHKDENLDYSKVVYVNNRTNVIVIDHDLDENGNEYGEYLTTPSNHLKGQSHPRKKGKKISNNKRFTTEHVIELFKEKHKDENLDYSLVEYKGMDVKVKIICNELNENGEPYGLFEQTPRIHLKGCTHPQLSIDKNKLKKRKTTEYFLERVKKVHGDKYDYSKSEYIKNDIPICIICPKHGEFWMTPENLYYGKGCPKCGNHLSYKEDEIAEIISKYHDVIKNDRKTLKSKEIDILIPNKNIGIEYNGLRWHSEWFSSKDKNYHLNKTIECNEQGIKLLQIFEDEYIEHKEIVLNKIYHILNIDLKLPKIMGRKCEIIEIDNKIAETFLNEYHIQGFARSTVYLGVLYDGNLVGVMSFKKENKDGYWELNRFASDYHYVCQGVGGKLFKYFIKKYNPIEIKSFADRRWTLDKNDNLYIKLGFKLEEILKPNYTYYNNSIDYYKRFHKFNFRKNILHKKYNLPLSMTESEMVKELGYDRIWDCGLFKFIWRKN